MSDMSIDRVTFLLNANREAGRKLQEQEHEKAKADQARLDEIAATQRKHAEEAVNVVMRAGAVNPDRAWKIVNSLLDAHFMARDGKVR
jgi:hypothetical protein